MGKRSEVIRIDGITVLNDSYNANPDSVVEALKTLRLMKPKGRRVAVLGDMLELGAKAEDEHRKIGRALTRFSVEGLFTFGPLSRHTYEAATVRVKSYTTDKGALVEQLSAFLSDGDVVLVKGSRGMKMEEVVARLLETTKA
ncbi:MAG TPA: cyanophycin synthetase [Terriglobia bacterium]|nr:cyanophycin synthetase [Terriglobia bacterium]